MEKFIERATNYHLRDGLLSLYETNCPCEDVQFFFEDHIMTVMISGHKTVISDNLKLEFVPGTFFIPERNCINTVSIPNASLYNPTRCLTLELNPSFIQSVYEEIFHSEEDQNILLKMGKATGFSYFCSNDELLLNAFTKLYNLQLNDSSKAKPLIERLLLKEILYRVFSTDGLELLKLSFANSIPDDSIRKTISHIKSNIEKKISVPTLANIAGLGQTTFYKSFKKATGHTPTDYVLHERIRQAKVLVSKDNFSLQQIAFKCGFNSYEYFCSSFKKIENVKPSEYKKMIA